MKIVFNTAISALLLTCISLPVQAADRGHSELADDIEMPDDLLGNTEPAQHKKSYGTDKIMLQKSGDMHDDIVTPDQMEQSLQPEHKGKEVELKQLQRTTEQDTALERPDELERKVSQENKKQTKPEKKPLFKREKMNKDELITPDPLMDSVEP